MATPPSVMKAVVLSELGGPENLTYTESQPVPKLGPGQVLVQNTYAGINYVDIYFRTGYYPAASGFPLIIGQEGVGKIVAIEEPNPLGFKIGERVVWIGQGGYAEYTALHFGQLVRIQDGISDEDAVGAHLMGMTAVTLLEEAFPVKKGDKVLLHAAAGGVGLIMCQMLRNIGAITIATAGGPEKCALAKENGATHVIDYRDTTGPSWVQQVKDLTDGLGVDVVYDSVGKDTWEGSFDVAKRKGKVVFFGTASGPLPPIDTKYIQAKNLSMMRPTLRQFLVTRPELEYYANQIQTLVKSGQVKIKVHKVYSLHEVAEAQNDLEGRKTTGKLLIRLPSNL